MYRAFLIEDEAMLREGLLMTTPWEAHGFTIVGSAADAIEGERLILKTRPDLIITDIRLPQISGLDLIERLNESLACDFIIISGYDAFPYAQKAIALGVKAYLLKPIDDAELLGALDKVRADIDRRKRIERSLAAALPAQDAKTEQTALGDRYMEAAMGYIYQHYPQAITVRNVADALCVSESYLSKLFKQKTGRSFLDALTQVRMQEAVRLLQTSNMKVYEIADALGYRDTEYFSALFRKVMGVKPSEFRRGK